MKKIFSLLLTCMIAVSTLFAGTITASGIKADKLSVTYSEYSESFDIYLGFSEEAQKEYLKDMKYCGGFVTISLQFLNSGNKEDIVSFEQTVDNDFLNQTVKKFGSCKFTFSLDTAKDIKQINSIKEADICKADIYYYEPTYTEHWSKNWSTDVTIIKPPKYIYELEFTEVDHFAVTGGSIKPEITVKDGDKILEKNVDYIVDYGKNIKIGKGYIVIYGKGNYTGYKILTFKIVPQSTKLKFRQKVSEIKLSWNKVTYIDGYQIDISTNGGKTWRPYKYLEPKVTSYTLKYDSSKNYTFRIRTFKTFCRTKYYSDWSDDVKI